MGNHKPSGAKNIDHILNESLWNNSFITAVRKPVFHHYPQRKRPTDLIRKLSNMANGKTKNDLNDGHFIDWLGIINSIPSNWKSQIELHFSDNTSKYNTAT